MKIYLLIILLPGLFTPSKAQNFNLVDTGKVWASTSCAWGWATSCVTNYYKMEQDTLIGGFIYKGVWQTGDSGLVNPNWYEIGFIREDSSRKVYYRDNFDNQDYPIYDFNITTGDTAHLTYNFMPLNLVVDSTSTILLQSQLRTVYYLHDPNFYFPYPQTWIEGIGSLDELLIMRAPQTDYSSDLLCFHENDTLKYFDPAYTDCYYSTLGVNELSVKNSFHIYPNPSDGKFTVEAENNSAGQIMDVKDISGKTILELKLSAGKTAVDLSEYPAGIYFLYSNGKGCGKVAVY